eukprot:jgi/Botrbrau1/21353/Bobra.0184s0062.1
MSRVCNNSGNLKSTRATLISGLCHCSPPSPLVTGQLIGILPLDGARSLSSVLMLTYQKLNTEEPLLKTSAYGRTSKGKHV